MKLLSLLFCGVVIMSWKEWVCIFNWKNGGGLCVKFMIWWCRILLCFIFCLVNLRLCMVIRNWYLCLMWLMRFLIVLWVRYVLYFICFICYYWSMDWLRCLILCCEVLCSGWSCVLSFCLNVRLNSLMNILNKFFIGLCRKFLWMFIVMLWWVGLFCVFWFGWIIFILLLKMMVLVLF